MCQGHAVHFVFKKVRENDAGENGGENRTAETFPGLSRADAWDHFVATCEGANNIRAGIAELGRQDEVKEIEMSVDTWKEVYLLNEIKEPWNVHQPKEGRGNGQNSGG